MILIYIARMPASVKTNDVLGRYFIQRKIYYKGLGHTLYTFKTKTLFIILCTLIKQNFLFL